MFKKLTLKDIKKADIKSIKAVEASVYPEHMQYMQDIRNVSDIEDYCEDNDVCVILKDSAYVIMASEEVVDMASVNPLSMVEMVEILGYMKSYYGSNVFSLDARESTSYKLLKFLSKRGTITILSEYSWDWDGVVMYEMELCFN